MLGDDLRESIAEARQLIALLRRQSPRFRVTAEMVLGDAEMAKAKWLFRDDLIAREEASLRQLLEFAALEVV